LDFQWKMAAVREAAYAEDDESPPNVGDFVDEGDRPHE
jgi:hypothetical protein